MKILASENDGFEFERAFVGELGGIAKPIAVMSGVVCNIDTDSDALADGLAHCEPLAPRLAREWPMSVVVVVVRERNGSGSSRRIPRWSPRCRRSQPCEPLAGSVWGLRFGECVRRSVAYRRR